MGHLRVRHLLMSGGALLILLILWSYQPNLLRHTATVSFLDVGQGDAILIQTPEQRHLLVDGGGTISFAKKGEDWKKRRDPYEVGNKLVVPLLKKRGIHVLDAIIISHNDTDHLGGLLAVVEHIPVRRIIFNGTISDSSNVQDLYRAALAKGIPLYQAGAGTIYQPDGSTTLRFLGPESDMGKLKHAQEQNNYSLVFMMSMLGSTFLFTGDMEKESEWAVLDLQSSGGVASVEESIIPIDVLKVAHHGSKTSTGRDWLTYWQPKYAVISAGKNNTYGHPSPVVMERLEKAGTGILRTDLQGEVRFYIKDSGITIRYKLR